MIVKNLTGKPDTDSRNTSLFGVVHPATHEAVHQVERSSRESFSKALQICHDALPSWSAQPLAERCSIFEKAASLLQDGSTDWKSRLAEANMKETSVTSWWTNEQLDGVPLFIRELTRAAHEVLVPEVMNADKSTVHIERLPFGVCLAIAAWNAVHLLTARAIITPLIAGNTVILKTSEHTPYTQTLWAELLHVNFTGSTNVGSILAGLAGKHLKPSLMELGGKAPVLLLPSADFRIAASHILFGTFMNAGQLCMSTERVLVPRSRYDDLVAALRDAWASVKQKEPRALFSSVSTCRVRNLIKDAIARGAEPLTGPWKEDIGNLVTPIILGSGTAEMKIFREESFGPVSIVIPIEDDGLTNEQVTDHMVALANDSDYGLTASVWSTDLQLAQDVARRLECGAVHINSPTAGDLPSVPHGGWKSSGWGRFNGAEGIRSFTQIRTIETEKGPGHTLPLDIFEL
ncbi:hypothetical protein CI109_104442 [Kwoniella shandongensis]|uniref:Aldehyde dehydrogenase domain-containing protein n=1 Tax=Kwoniella shandongensis TaxID=1734106 RepID=A0AAJ8LLF0_9TREE